MSEQMREEFEQWAKDYYGYASDDLAIHGKFYIYSTVEECWQIWQVAYQAGRKAERENIWKFLSPEARPKLIKLLDDSETKNEGLNNV